MPINQGLGANPHKRAFKGVDYRIKAIPTDVTEAVPYDDYGALANFVSQFTGDYGDADADLSNPISIFIGAESAPVVGVWVNLPTTEDIIDEVTYMVSFGHRSDWDVMDIAAMNSAVYSWAEDNLSIEVLNNAANEITRLSDRMVKPFELVLMEWQITDDIEDAVNIAEEVQVYESRRDAAYEMIEYATNPEFYFDMEKFRHTLEIDGNWYEESEIYQDYDGDFDAYVDSMYEIMSSDADPQFWIDYLDVDSFMGDVEIEASTYEDSSGYYVLYY